MTTFPFLISIAESNSDRAIELLCQKHLMCLQQKLGVESIERISSAERQQLVQLKNQICNKYRGQFAEDRDENSSTSSQVSQCINTRLQMSCEEIEIASMKPDCESNSK